MKQATTTGSQEVQNIPPKINKQFANEQKTLLF
jgi:hypothetical protein